MGDTFFGERWRSSIEVAAAQGREAAAREKEELQRLEAVALISRLTVRLEAALKDLNSEVPDILGRVVRDSDTAIGDVDKLVDHRGRAVLKTEDFVGAVAEVVRWCEEQGLICRFRTERCHLNEVQFLIDVFPPT